MLIAFKGGYTPWFIVGFESIVAFASVFGVLVARARFETGPAMVLGLIAMTLVVATGLELVSARLAVRQLLVHPYFLVRMGLAVVLGAAAAVVVLSRDARSWRTAISGALLAFGGIGLAAGTMIALKRLAPASAAGQAVELLVMMVVGTVALGAVCVGAHFVIKAFEYGRLKPAP